MEEIYICVCVCMRNIPPRQQRRSRPTCKAGTVDLLQLEHGGGVAERRLVGGIIGREVGVGGGLGEKVD